MRFAEGLRYVKTNRDLLYADISGTPALEDNGVYMDGDLLYAEQDDELVPYAEADRGVTLGGRRLHPLVKAYRVPWELLAKTKQKIL